MGLTKRANKHLKYSCQVDVPVVRGREPGQLGMFVILNGQLDSIIFFIYFNFCWFNKF